MNILFLTLNNSNSFKERGIYTDLLNEFIKNGHTIYIVCPNQKRESELTRLENISNFKILSVKTGNITQTNILEKGISTILLESQYLKAIKKYITDIKFDLILYSTPPITFDKVIRYFKKRDNSKTYLLLKDIFPQNAVDLRMFSKKSPLYWFFRRKEKRLYKISDYIGCMSKANVSYVKKNNKYIEEDKIEIAPNSINPVINVVLNQKIKEEVLSKYKIPKNKTIYLYAGNLGKPQGLDFLCNIILENEKRENSFFLVIGSGTEFKKLENFIDTNKILNSKLFGKISKEEYDLLANVCDVGLILLDKRFTIPNFPSRILSYMEMQMPILAATDINTDLKDVITINQFGLWCESGDLSAFFKHMDTLKDTKIRNIMGDNSRKYLEENYTVNHTYDMIMKHFIEKEVNANV